MSGQREYSSARGSDWPAINAKPSVLSCLQWVVGRVSSSILNHSSVRRAINAMLRRMRIAANSSSMLGKLDATGLIALDKKISRSKSCSGPVVEKPKLDASRRISASGALSWSNALAWTCTMVVSWKRSGSIVTNSRTRISSHHCPSARMTDAFCALSCAITQMPPKGSN